MRKLIVIVSTLLTMAATSFAGVVVSLKSPQPGSTAASPVLFTASASSSYPITGWHIYIDSVNVFGANNTASISSYVAAAAGTHQVVIRAWDSTGAYGSVSEQITVGNAAGPISPLPTPPPTATVFSKLEDASGWGSCDAGNCAGGSGAGAYWMAQFQTTPSLDGSSTEFFNSGVSANALWWKKLGAADWATNLLWDFYFQVDNASLTATQALEFDSFQFVGGYNYMIGSQCNYAAAVWDVWNENAGHWVHTAIACPKFSPGVWHHIQWYVQRVPNTTNYQYVTLVVDGQAHAVNTTYPAKYNGWADNIGVQYQLDVNATGGGYHEWVDKSTLTIW